MKRKFRVKEHFILEDIKNWYKGAIIIEDSYDWGLLDQYGELENATCYSGWLQEISPEKEILNLFDIKIMGVYESISYENEGEITGAHISIKEYNSVFGDSIEADITKELYEYLKGKEEENKITIQDIIDRSEGISVTNKVFEKDHKAKKLKIYWDGTVEFFNKDTIYFDEEVLGRIGDIVITAIKGYSIRKYKTREFVEWIKEQLKG